MQTRTGRLKVKPEPKHILDAILIRPNICFLTSHLMFFDSKIIPLFEGCDQARAQRGF